MSEFGWSLPAGTRLLPGEMPEEPSALKCPTCGRFIKKDVVRTEVWEEVIVDDYGKPVKLVSAEFVHYYRCGKCGETRCPSPIWRC